MVATVKFSQFVAGNLSNTSNQIVGVSAPSNGTNFQIPFPLVWTTSTRPVSPKAGMQGYNSSLGQIEYWNGGSWVQLAAGGSGSVNLGAINQLAYYAANGTALSGLMTANNSILTTNSSGFPVWSTTSPTGINLPQPNIIGVTNGSNASVGSVGEYMISQVMHSSPISITGPNVDTDITTLSLTAGDWDVWGNVYFENPGAGTGNGAWLNTIPAVEPDFSLVSNFAANNTLGDSVGGNISTRRFSITTTTTIYFSVVTSGAGCNVSGFIAARRVR